MSEAAAKFCADKLCTRKGQKLDLLSEFTVDNNRKDGRNIYCRLCAQRHAVNARQKAKQGSPAPKADRKKLKAKPLKVVDTDAERVLRALRESEDPLRFKLLARRAKLSYGQLSDVLARIHGRDRQVLSRNGTGPRVYFLNPSPLPTTSIVQRRKVDLGPPLSFSTLSELFPVTRGGKMTDFEAVREGDLEEINRLAQELGYINGDDRTIYEALLGAYFPDATSARDLNTEDRGQWLGMLRLWKAGRAMNGHTPGEAPQEERRTA